MKVIWTDFAANSLFEIYRYYSEAASQKVAQRIRFKIFSATRQLTKHPISGQVEPTLQKLGEDHRYLVEGNFKIIYRKVKEGVLITDVFDTRQDPIRIHLGAKKPSR